jgi:N-methylhydantoinase A/oxoprolinase/acetone carboxylase beta subunit
VLVDGRPHSTPLDGNEQDEKFFSHALLKPLTAHQMADAIREVTGERGQDPREATLVAFGGAGPLFATMLARELDIGHVVVPPYAGNFSAWGLLGQDLVRSSASTSVASLTEEGIEAAGRELLGLFDRLVARSSSLGPVQQHEAALDMRYVGQDYTLTIPVSFDESRGAIAGDVTSIAEADECRLRDRDVLGDPWAWAIRPQEPDCDAGAKARRVTS